MKLEEIKRMVSGLDAKLQPEEEAFKAAVVLLSALEVGADAEKLHRFTGYPLPFIRRLEERLRENGVWRGEKTCAAWDREDGGVIAFWLDVLVALGHARRTHEERTKNKVRRMVDRKYVDAKVWLQYDLIRVFTLVKDIVNEWSSHSQYDADAIPVRRAAYLYVRPDTDSLEVEFIGLTVEIPLKAVEELLDELVEQLKLKEGGGEA